MTSQTKDHPFKNHQMPLSMRLFFAAMTVIFKVLGIASPRLAGKLALHLFMSPPKFGIPRRERKLRDEATLTHLNIRGNKISVRSWGDESSPAVLLSHGWGGRCTQLHAFIQPLVDAGYRVVGFDLTGHGDSTGKYSNMLDGASIISEVTKTEGPFEAIVGHSFGSAATLLSIDKFQLKVKKVVLISCFSDVFWVTEKFGEIFALRKSTREAMQQLAVEKFTNNYGVSWNWEAISPINTIKSVKEELFLIHDETDHEVPYDQAVLLQKAAPQAKILTTSGYGHRKILMSKQCIAAVVDFIRE